MFVPSSRKPSNASHLTSTYLQTLQRQLEATREKKCQEVAALQEVNALTVTRLRERITSLESQLNDLRESQQPPTKDPSSSVYSLIRATFNDRGRGEVDFLTIEFFVALKWTVLFTEGRQ